MVLDVCGSIGVARVAVGGCLVAKGWQQVADVVASNNHQRRQPNREAL